MSVEEGLKVAKSSRKKRYPNPYPSPPCPFAAICPFTKEDPKRYADIFPRYYGKRLRCHYVGIFQCPVEDKYPSDARYDEEWPYPVFSSLFWRRW